jgi:hypothetical protein
VDPADATLYKIRITGTLSSYTSNYYEISLTLNDLCTSTLIGVTELSPIIYNVYSAAISFEVTPFSSTVSDCGTFSYQAYLGDINSPLTLDSISFDNSILTFTV